ncbi:hypothetical protein pb186bvf_006289 [Paramecium bursaria]
MKFQQLQMQLNKQQRNLGHIIHHCKFLIRPSQEILDLSKSILILMDERETTPQKLSMNIMNFQRMVLERRITMKHYRESLIEREPESQLGLMMNNLLKAMQSYLYESYNPSYLAPRSRSATNSTIQCDNKWVVEREVKQKQRHDEKQRLIDDIERYREQSNSQDI